MSREKVIRLMPGQNNKLQICFGNTFQCQIKKDLPNDSSGSTESRIETTVSTKANPAGIKRRKAEKEKKKGAKQPAKIEGSSIQKKPKYERKNYRLNNIENSKLSWAELGFQANNKQMQAQMQLEYPKDNIEDIQILANALIFNENIGILRNRVRKDCLSQLSKKALSRSQFNQSQAFYGVSYRPGSAFINNQNFIGKGVQVTPVNFFKQINALPHSSSVQINADCPYSVSNTNEGGNFICSICRRTDAKKYAKNLCQTCYKRQKRIIDFSTQFREDDYMLQAEFVAKPEENNIPTEIDKEIDSIIEWNGICPDCNK